MCTWALNSIPFSGSLTAGVVRWAINLAVCVYMCERGLACCVLFLPQKSINGRLLDSKINQGRTFQRQYNKLG